MCLVATTRQTSSDAAQVGQSRHRADSPDAHRRAIAVQDWLPISIFEINVEMGIGSGIDRTIRNITGLTEEIGL